MKIKCKDWSLKKDEITGNYAVMMGEKEVASNSFNGEYGGEKIVFSGDIMVKVRELNKLIEESIENNFGGAE